LSKKKPVELWWQDEARLGQKNGLVRHWARRGTRPRQPADQRYQNAYLFGAICPARGTGAAIMMPKANTRAMQLHLNEISRAVARGAHAAVLMDRAGWHTARQHHHHPAAIALAGAEPSGKHLAVHAPELAVEPRLPNLRCHSGRRMPGLEQAHQ